MNEQKSPSTQKGNNIINFPAIFFPISHFGICYETQQTNTKIKMSKKGNQLIRGAIRGVFSQRTISEQSLIFDSII